LSIQLVVEELRTAILEQIATDTNIPVEQVELGDERLVLTGAVRKYQPAIRALWATLGDGFEDTLDGYLDADGDGWGDPCDHQPLRADSYPGAPELCDGEDNDCNSEIDEDAMACDDDNDCTEDTCERGLGCVNILTSGIPCDDNDDCTVNDVCQPTGSCAGDLIDADGDGYAPAPCGLDCNDTNSHMSPGIFEGGPRDSLVCTDGIGEVRNAEGELFEHSAITEQLIMNADHYGSDLANAVIEASRAFSHPGHQWDDITVLGIDLK